jgi:hypothetical protein
LTTPWLCLRFLTVFLLCCDRTDISVISSDTRTPLIFTYVIALSVLFFLDAVACSCNTHCSPVYFSAKTQQSTMLESTSTCCMSHHRDFPSCMHHHVLHSFSRYAEGSASFATDDTLILGNGANVFVRNYNICRSFCLLTSYC